MTTGYKGGLQSRGGYAVHSSDELPEGEKDYLDRIANLISMPLRPGLRQSPQTSRVLYYMIRLKKFYQKLNMAGI